VVTARTTSFCLPFLASGTPRRRRARRQPSVSLAIPFTSLFYRRVPPPVSRRRGFLPQRVQHLNLFSFVRFSSNSRSFATLAADLVLDPPISRSG
jgi:hypothetical protein